MCLFRSQLVLGVYREIWMISLIGEKERDICSCTWSIVVGELYKGQEVSLVILLIIAIHMEVLFQSLISPLSLAIPLWMISRGEVKIDVQGLTERTEKVRYKLWIPIGGDMREDSMVGEYMGDKEFC